MKKILVCSCLCLISALPLAGRENGWVHFNNSSRIRAVYQTGDSRWIGTNGGLYIYDSLADDFIAKYLVGDQLNSSSIRTIEKRGDSLFVGTDEGLTLFYGTDAYTYRTEYNPVFNNVRSIDFSPTGHVCIGTYGRGAGMLFGDSLTVVTRRDSLLDDRVFAVLRMDDSTCFYATARGLCAFRDTLWESFRVGAGLPKGEVRDLMFTEDYAMYALVAGEGVFYFDGSRGRRISPRGLSAGRNIAAIALDERHVLWVAGSNGGIAKYEYGDWTELGASDPVVQNTHWQSVHAGSNGQVYFGSSDGFILSMGGDKVGKLSIPSTLPSNAIRASAEDSAGFRYLVAGPHFLSVSGAGGEFITEEIVGPVLSLAVAPGGELWCSTRWGLFRKTGGRFEELPVPTADRPPIFTAIRFDPYGQLWAGTDRGEIFKYDGLVWLRLGEKVDLMEGSIDRLEIDGDGTVWALAVRRGLFRFDGTSWINSLLQEFNDQALVDMAVDPSGRLVLAGRRGLWRYGRDRTWQPVSLPDLDKDLSLTRFCFDDQGRLYLGTSRGLLLVSGDSHKFFRPADGIGGTEVSSLMIDSGGLLWVGFLSEGLSLSPVDRLW